MRVSPAIVVVLPCPTDVIVPPYPLAVVDVSRSALSYQCEAVRVPPSAADVRFKFVPAEVPHLRANVYS